MQFYGLDYIALLLGFTSQYLLGSKKKSGFLFAIMTYILWIIVGFFIHSIPIVIGNIIYIVIAIRGYINWNKSKSNGN